MELDLENELEEALVRGEDDSSDSAEESEEEVPNKPQVPQPKPEVLQHTQDESEDSDDGLVIEYPPDVPQNGGDGLVQQDTLDKRQDDDDDLEKELEEALNAAADDSDSEPEEFEGEQTRDLRPKRRLIMRHEQDRLRLIKQEAPNSTAIHMSPNSPGTTLDALADIASQQYRATSGSPLTRRNPLPDNLAKSGHVDDEDRGEEAPQKPHVRPRRTTKKLGLSDYKAVRMKKADTPNKKSSANSPTLSHMGSFNSGSPPPIIQGIPIIQDNAVIEPPPADSVKGDEHLPWLQLNAYELALP